MKRHTTDTKKRRQWTHRAARKRLQPARHVAATDVQPDLGHGFEEVGPPAGPVLKESDRAYLAAGDFTKECAARKRLRDAGLIAYNVKAHTWTRT